MDFTEQYLGKKLDKINFKDIENYFKTEQEESDTIEFKSFKGKDSKDLDELFKKHIIPTLIAFMNSAGGLLIIGAPEDKNGKCHGTLNPLPYKEDKDRILNKVVSQIIPMPDTIGVKVIEDSNTNSCVIIFSIDISEYRPHQYQYDKAYYMRLDGKKVKAPHHYVEALMKRVRYPQLSGHVFLTGNSHLQDNHYDLQITVVISNDSPFINEYDVVFTVSSSKGQFIERQYIHNNQVEIKNNELHSKELAGTMHYGQSTVLRHNSLRVSRFEFDFNTQPLRLTLTFGGKNSPLRVTVVDVEVVSFGDKKFKHNLVSHNKLLRDIIVNMNDDEIMDEVSKIFN